MLFTHFPPLLMLCRLLITSHTNSLTTFFSNIPICQLFPLGLLLPSPLGGVVNQGLMSVPGGGVLEAQTTVLTLVGQTLSAPAGVRWLRRALGSGEQSEARISPSGQN